jgi:hypothetical protein
MPSQHTKKRFRDERLFALWESRPADDFTNYGISRERLREAQLGLQGYIVFPGDPHYNQDRMLSNPRFDAHPQMIIYCLVESDVEIALGLVSGLPAAFTVRSGGHCTAGFSASNGPLIDVSGLNDVTVDADDLVATVGCGCTFGKLDSTLSRYNLHVPGGECSDVCVGGYVQGGGYGFTSVTFGMNCDNVIDMRVMLGDGSVVIASDLVNYDLFWAMRGGTGGSFGILLSLRYRLRPLGLCFGWSIAWPLLTSQNLADATGALMTLQEHYMLDKLPKALNIQVTLAYQPQWPADPPIQVYPYLLLRGLYVGTAAEGQQAIARLCALPGATTQWTTTQTFEELNETLLNYPYSLPYFPPNVNPKEDKASRYVERKLAADEWRAILDLFVSTPNPYSYMYLELYGGAINAYPEGENAFIHRRAAFNAVLDVFWIEPDQEAPAEAFLDTWIALLDTMSNGHVYQNYPRVNEPNYQWAYWGLAAPGLYKVKCKYDPLNRFRFAQEVHEPADAPPAKLPARLIESLAEPIRYARRVSPAS